MKCFGLLATLLLSVSAGKETIWETAFKGLGGEYGNDIDVTSLGSRSVPFAASSFSLARAADENEDGKISKEEFKKISEDILDALFQMSDIDRDGYVSEDELLEGGYTLDGTLSVVKIAFKGADFNRDSFISSADIMDYMGIPPESITNIMTKLDSNKDGRITLQEYQDSESSKSREYQEYESNQSRELPGLVKVIKLLDRDLDGQIGLVDVNNFVKAFWSIIDKDGNGNIEIDEWLLMLKQNGFSDEQVAKLNLKKMMTNVRNFRKTILREIFPQIDEDGDGQIGRDELIDMLNKPFPDEEMQAKIVKSYQEIVTKIMENYPGPEMHKMEDRDDMDIAMINVLDSLLDSAKFSEFKSSSNKSTAMFTIILISALIALI